MCSHLSFRIRTLPSFNRHSFFAHLSDRLSDRPFIMVFPRLPAAFLPPFCHLSAAFLSARPSSPLGRSGGVLLLGIHCLTSSNGNHVVDVIYRAATAEVIHRTCNTLQHRTDGDSIT